MIEFLRIFEFHNLHLIRGRLMLPDSISEKKLKIDWKIEDLWAGSFWCRLHWGLEQPAPEWPRFVDLPFFNHFLNFSSEMESGNISPPLIKCQLRNSKILKNSITLLYDTYYNNASEHLMSVQLTFNFDVLWKMTKNQSMF